MIAISETVSEKPKRGRPAIFTDNEKRSFASLGLFLENESDRGKQNVFYRQLAVSRLMNDERFYWIVGGSQADIMSGRAPKMRFTILSELGRILDENEMVAVALEICKHKPKAHEAKLMIRRYRGCRRKQADAMDLANAIIHTINDYWKRFPETTVEQTLDALQTAAVQVKQQGKTDSDGNCGGAE